MEEIDVHGLDELLGAYALDAVDDDERRRVEEYLRVSPRAAAEVEQHREVATMLAYTGMDAPAGLWDRILSELDEPAPAPPAGLAKVLPLDERRRTVRSAMTWVAATAAAAAIAVLAVGVLDRGDAPSDPVLAAAEAARSDRDSRITDLVADGSEVVVEAIIDNDGHGFVLADGLPELGADQTYQLWGIVGEQVISIGVLGPHPETEIFTVKGDLVGLAITIEPAGGVISDGNPEGAFVGMFA